MISLSISTSGKYNSVAIYGESLIASSTVESKNGSTSILMNSIDEVFKKSNKNKNNLEVVYLDIGPGFYTSLRIGLAVAQGICASLGLPLVPVNGLDALSYAAHTGHRKIYSIIDIKREEFAFCTYKPVPGGVVKSSEPEILNQEDIKQKLSEDNEKKLVVGNWQGLELASIKDSSFVKLASPEFVTADYIQNLGKEIFRSGEFPNFNEVQIAYMREPDVLFSSNNLEQEVNFYD